jgi:5-methylcytosine-specific restriction endonuclease McrA
MTMFSVILLNGDYTFLNVVSVQRAFNLVFKEKVDVVAYADAKIKTPEKEYAIPAVLRLKEAISRMYSKKVRYSKRNVFIRDDFTCQYCGKENLRGKDRTTDHVFPQSRGGKNKFSNVVTCCRKCNTYKGDKLLHETGMMFYKPGWKPYTPTFYEHLMKKSDEWGVKEKLIELGVF